MPQGEDNAAPEVEEKKAHMPNPREGEHVFGVAHIFASFNDTFVVRRASPSLTRTLLRFPRCKNPKKKK